MGRVPGSATASCSRIRSASPSRRCARWCSSTADCSTSTRRCSATGPSSQRRPRCATCSPTRRESLRSSAPARTDALLRLGRTVRAARGAATGVAAWNGSRRIRALLRPPGRRDRAPHRRSRTRSVPARRGVRARRALTSSSGSRQRTNPAPSTSPASRTSNPIRAICIARATNNPPGTRDAAVVNGAAWRAAEVPADQRTRHRARHRRSLCGTAWRAAALAGAVSRSRVGAVRGRRPGLRARERLGTRLCAWTRRDSAWAGSGGSYGGACTRGGYAIAFVTGTMGTHARGERVENALRSRLGLPPI